MEIAQPHTDVSPSRVEQWSVIMTKEEKKRGGGGDSSFGIIKKIRALKIWTSGQVEEGEEEEEATKNIYTKKEAKIMKKRMKFVEFVH